MRFDSYRQQSLTFDRFRTKNRRFSSVFNRPFELTGINADAFQFNQISFKSFELKYNIFRKHKLR